MQAICGTHSIIAIILPCAYCAVAGDVVTGFARFCCACTKAVTIRFAAVISSTTAFCSSADMVEAFTALMSAGKAVCCKLCRLARLIVTPAVHTPLTMGMVVLIAVIASSGKPLNACRPVSATCTGGQTCAAIWAGVWITEAVVPSALDSSVVLQAERPIARAITVAVVSNVFMMMSFSVVKLKIKQIYVQT